MATIHTYRNKDKLILILIYNCIIGLTNQTFLFKWFLLYFFFNFEGQFSLLTWKISQLHEMIWSRLILKEKYNLQMNIFLIFKWDLKYSLISAWLHMFSAVELSRTQIILTFPKCAYQVVQPLWAHDIRGLIFLIFF